MTAVIGHSSLGVVPERDRSSRTRWEMTSTLRNPPVMRLARPDTSIEHPLNMSRCSIIFLLGRLVGHLSHKSINNRHACKPMSYRLSFPFCRLPT